ncbi:hypothetical protein RFI_05049, partial [Reticulomyxa filosa]
DEKLEKSELDGIEALKNLIIVAVPQISGETLRLVLGMKENNHPKILNNQMMTQELKETRRWKRQMYGSKPTKNGLSKLWERKLKEQERSKTVSADQLKMVTLEVEFERKV